MVIMCNKESEAELRPNLMMRVQLRQRPPATPNIIFPSVFFFILTKQS